MNKLSKESPRALYTKFKVFMSFALAMSIAGCATAGAISTDENDTAGVAACEALADDTASSTQEADDERILSPAEYAPIPIHPNEKVTIYVIGGNGVGFAQSDEDGNLFEDPNFIEGLNSTMQVYTNCTIVEIKSESDDVRYFRIKNNDGQKNVTVRVFRVQQ